MPGARQAPALGLVALTTRAQLAEPAALAAGVNLSVYTRHVYAFPQNACPWWGLGSVGGTPSQAWINGSLALKVGSHDLGHNLGLYHAHSLAGAHHRADPWRLYDGTTRNRVQQPESPGDSGVDGCHHKANGTVVTQSAITDATGRVVTKVRLKATAPLGPIRPTVMPRQSTPGYSDIAG